MDAPETDRHLARLELFATWLDRRFIDPMVSFLAPGLGSMACTLLGLYSVYVAVRIKVHPVVIARMLINLSIDALVGSVPILGVVFDIFFRAHVRNLELVKSRGVHGAPTLSDWLAVSLGCMLVAVALLLPLILAALLFTWLLSLFH